MMEQRRCPKRAPGPKSMAYVEGRFALYILLCYRLGDLGFLTRSIPYVSTSGDQRPGINLHTRPVVAILKDKESFVASWFVLVVVTCDSLACSDGLIAGLPILVV